MTLFWIITWALLLVFEFISPLFFCIFLSFGALSALLVAWFGYDLIWQLISFSAVSIISILVLRKALKSVFSGKEQKGSEQTHPLYGQYGKVIKAIEINGIGEISAGGSFWKAVCDTALTEGSECIVEGSLSNDALILKVKPV